MDSFPELVTMEILGYFQHKYYRLVSRKWQKILDSTICSINSINPSQMNPAIFKQFPDMIDWSELSRENALSEDFINRWSDRVDWEEISRCQILSEEFIAAHSDRVNWSAISKFQILSEEWIEKWEKRVDWVVISWNQKNKRRVQKRNGRTKYI